MATNSKVGYVSWLQDGIIWIQVCYVETPEVLDSFFYFKWIVKCNDAQSILVYHRPYNIRSKMLLSCPMAISDSSTASSG